MKPKKIVRALKRKIRLFFEYGRYLYQFKIFKGTDGDRFKVSFSDRIVCLLEGDETTSFDKHYVYHTAWAARKLAEYMPEKHIDISSYTYFSTVASAFVPIDFYDYRPASIDISNLNTLKGDITSLSFDDASVESISCMHVIEHIGLGRYGDPLDPDADLLAFRELNRVLAPGGALLFVVPIGGCPRVVFNAHRIYTYDQVMTLFDGLKLKEFSLIPDKSPEGIIIDASREVANEQKYGCGCFWFERPEN